MNIRLLFEGLVPSSPEEQCWSMCAGLPPLQWLLHSVGGGEDRCHPATPFEQKQMCVRARSVGRGESAGCETQFDASV